MPAHPANASVTRRRCRADLEFEMDRFTEALGEVDARYTYMERPRGTVQQQVGGPAANGWANGWRRSHSHVNRSLLC